jgi:hypothetical protein
MTDLSGISTADLQALYQQMAQQPPQIAASGSVNDPSVGIGTLSFGPWDTGVQTPQWVNRTLAGTGRGMVHGVRRLGNLLGMVPDETLTNEKAIDTPLMNTTGGRVGNLIGEAALTAPIGLGAAGLVGKAGTLGASMMGNGILNSALQGAVQGATTSDPGEGMRQALIGALTGGTLAAAGKGIGKLAYGLTRSSEAQTLLDEGIQLTPGQMNPGGAMNQFEQAAESIPGVKQIIHAGRDNAEQQFQAAVIAKGAAPGAIIKPSENIHEMLQSAYDSYKPLYDPAKGILVKPLINVDGKYQTLAKAFDDAASTPGATQDLKESAGSWLKNQLTKIGKNPESDDLLDIRSAIRTRTRQINLSNDINKQDAIEIYKNAEQAVTKSLQSQLPPDALASLNLADSNYGRYKVVENAVAKAKDNIAGLTPQKLSQAIYEATADPAYARGAGGELRDLAQAGTKVFQTVSPPTGARVATLGAALGAGYAAPHVAIPASVAPLWMAGTESGRRFAAGQLAPQQAIQELGQKMSAHMTPEAQELIRQLMLRGAQGATVPYVPAAGAGIGSYLLSKVGGGS